jgi:hypothetical protein
MAKIFGLQSSTSDWNVGIASLDGLGDVLFPLDSNYWIADPFLFKHKEVLYLFVEYFDKSLGRGCIGFSSYLNGNWLKFERCLIEDFHLSFPRIVKANSDIFLTVESSSEPGVRLYKSINFPADWTLVEIIDCARRLKDPLILKDSGRFFMLASTIESNGYAELLMYEGGESIYGSWFLSKNSPVKRRRNRIRNAGMILDDLKLIRVSQSKLFGIYGFNVSLYEINRPISGTGFREKRIRNTYLKKPKGAAQFHTLNSLDDMIAYDYKF